LFEKTCSQGKKKITLVDKKSLLSVKKKDVKKTTATASKMGDHNLFELLGWNPLAIIILALCWSSNPDQQSLGDLYEMVYKNNPSLRNQTDALNLGDRMKDAINISTKVQLEALRKGDEPGFKLL